MESIINYLKSAYGRLYSRINTPFMRYGAIGKFVFIDHRYSILSGLRYAEIGDYTRVMSDARIQLIGKYQSKKFSPKLIIGKEVLINQNFHCTCAELIIIGDGTSITANCGICDIIHPYQDVNVNPRHQEIMTKPVIIGSNCLIGMNTVIMPGVTLGHHVIVGANSTVMPGAYPDYCVMAGSPAKIIKVYNTQKKEWEKI